MNGFRKISPIFLSHYATFFAKMAKRKVVPFDEFYYQLKLMYLFQKHPVCIIIIITLVDTFQLLINHLQFFFLSLDLKNFE
jgi:hypothetical protein